MAWWDARIGNGYNPRGHTGVDLELPSYTPLTTLLPGRVIKAQREPWGGEVDIATQLPDGTPVIEVFAHLDAVLARVGQALRPGDLLGLSGGENLPAQYSDGPHLHFALYRGTEQTVQRTPGGNWYADRAPNGAPLSLDPTPLLDAARASEQGGGSNIFQRAGQTVQHGIGNAAGSAAGGIAGAAQAAAVGAARELGAGTLASVGAQSLPDLLWRVGLIVAGLILVLVGLHQLFAGGTGDGGTGGGAQAQAAQVAQLLAKVAPEAAAAA